jgi:[ribosomal protein S5]-alanine N-acetyltransferase
MNAITPPTLTTPRLVLRPFSLSDAPRVKLLAGDREIASTTLRVPHPYEHGMAEAWIETHAQLFAEGKSVSLAVTLREAAESPGDLIGAIGLEIAAENERAELGYWIGKDYWAKGYCTEAARAVVRYGFEVLRLHRVCAHHLARNPASGRVMQKIGMRAEGVLRGHIKKWGRFEDVVGYGLLHSEFDANRQPD